MRNEKTLDVNVHTRALRAAERTGPNGNMHDTLYPEEPTWKERLFDLLPSPEELTVAGRAVKGFVVPHWAAAVLLGAILTAAGFAYRSWNGQIESLRADNQTQRDLLIRMDQRLIDKEKHDLEKKEELDLRLQNYDAVNIVMNRDIQALKAQRR